MKKRIFALLLALIAALGLLAGCSPADLELGLEEQLAQAERAAPEETANLATIAPSETAAETALPETEPPEAPDETPYPDPTPAPFDLDEDGEYTAPMDVAAYLDAFGHLPSNFITKREAQALGWPGGDLWKYAPGKSIGGDRFGNYEGLLPDGTTYKECDVNYSGGSRGAERLIYGADGSIYYTDDHYASFTRLY